MEKEEKKEIHIEKIIMWGIVGIILLTLFFGSFYTVNAGYRAIVLTFGDPNMNPQSEGLHFKVPFIQSIVQMDIKTQKYEADLTAASRDLQDVNTKIAINYHLVSESVPKIYKEIGIDYAARIIQPLEQETNKAITSQFTAEELITKRDSVRQKMKDQLSEKLLPRGIVVEEVSIINFAFSPSFSQAIEAKVTAEQSALAAKNKLEQVKYEAQQAIEAANGKAQAIKVEGDALRSNPQVAQLRAIEKWNGILPQVTGGAMPFINLNQGNNTF